MAEVFIEPYKEEQLHGVDEPNTASDLYALAVGKYKSGDYQEAIDAFHKSLSLQEDWNSYQGLGFALYRSTQFAEAIDAFRKSLALQEHWNSYQGLGWALFRTNQYQEAIEAFRKALALYNLNSNELTAQLHRELADAYDGAGNSDASIASWEVYLSYLEPISSLDPFLGNGGIYEQVDHEKIERIKSTCASIGLDFNPSFKGDKDASIESWKYLMYLHIPKCGGDFI